MKRPSLTTALVFTASAAALSVPFLVFADDTFVSLTSLPGINSLVGSPSLPSFVNNLYRLCIGAAALFAFVEIVWAGYLFMTSSDSISKNTKARQKIMNAVIGLVLVLSPYIVFSIIDPKILDLSLDFTKLQSKNGTGPDATFGAFGTNSTEQVQANICAPYLKSGGKVAFATLTGSQTCSAVKGKGWAAVQCCSGATPAGQTCCGYDPLNDQNVSDTANLRGPFSFSIAYQDSAYLKESDSKPSACVAYDDRSYQDKQSCSAAFSGATAKGLFAVGKTCDEASSHSLTPPENASKLNALPTCPK